MYEFISSLGLIGYLLIGVLGLAIWNLRKLWKLHTPLDSPQHKAWPRSHECDHQDHLDPLNKP
mgnify:CR=1 FL=1